MKKTLLIAAALMLAGQAFSKTVRRVESISVTESERPMISTGMDGKIGIGFDTIPGASSGGAPIVPAVGTANALDFRYWVNDAWAVEALAALSATSGGAGENIFGLGLGAKYNFRKPVEDVLVQMIGRFTFASDTVAGANISTVSVWVGTGFEAFIPVWRAISVEGNVGLGFLSQSRPGTSATAFGINGNGFSPISVAVHYYFGS